MSVSRHFNSDSSSSESKCVLASPAVCEIVSNSHENSVLLPVMGVSGPDLDKDGGAGTPSSDSAGENINVEADMLVLTTPKSKKGTAIDVFRSCVTGNCQCCYVLGGNKTQLKPCRFAALMFVNRQASVSDLEVFSCVVDGVDIVSGEVQPYDCRNYQSILDQDSKSKMDVIVTQEIDNGILSVTHNKPQCIHALGAVSKPDGGIRLITDCSRPEGVSVNCNVEGLPLSFQYKSIDNVVELLSRDNYMSVIDIKSAYRSVSVNPDQVRYQGLRWVLNGEEIYLLDHRLCFGLHCGPFYFNLLSNFIYERLVDIHGIRLVNYLDDYIVIADSYVECIENQAQVLAILRYVGFQISWSKVSAPSRLTRYLGIDVDSIKMELRLPSDKIEKMLCLIKMFREKKIVSRKDVQKLTGLLAHCATLFKGGRSYTRRLYDLEKVAGKTKNRRVKLTEGALDDLLWWEKFGAHFNGRSTIKKKEYHLKPTSDSSQKGFGAFLGTDWFCGSWGEPVISQIGCGHVLPPPLIPDEDQGNINVYELYPVVEGIRRWKDLFRGYLVVVVTDNLQVYHIIRTGRSINRTCMNWVRDLFWLCATNDIELVPEYIASCDDIVADSPSRLRYSRVANNISQLINNHELCCMDSLFEFCRS